MNANVKKYRAKDLSVFITQAKTAGGKPEVRIYSKATRKDVWVGELTYAEADSLRGKRLEAFLEEKLGEALPQVLVIPFKEKMLGFQVDAVFNPYVGELNIQCSRKRGKSVVKATLNNLEFNPFVSLDSCSTAIAVKDILHGEGDVDYKLRCLIRHLIFTENPRDLMKHSEFKATMKDFGNYEKKAGTSAITSLIKALNDDFVLNVLVSRLMSFLERTGDDDRVVVAPYIDFTNVVVPWELTSPDQRNLLTASAGLEHMVYALAPLSQVSASVVDSLEEASLTRALLPKLHRKAEGPFLVVRPFTELLYVADVEDLSDMACYTNF